MIFLGGTYIDSCNGTQEYIIEMWGGTESDLQCCNGGGRLAKMFPPALQSYLGNDSYY